jgi:arsenite methyltransferase
MAELTTGANPTSSCCPPEAQATCCEPSEKQACCGTGAAGGSCGCSAAQKAAPDSENQIRETVRERYAAAART